jgi:alkanesulfonate monooxygenase SsuD/methylene tetrahydromethanopterin reductase-like flavin-dependent oxidoreductase (luciferase family)
MDFGIFSMFTTSEGLTQAQVFKEWFDLVRVPEDLGIDTFWLGESHFRPNRALLASPSSAPARSPPGPHAYGWA